MTMDETIRNYTEEVSKIDITDQFAMTKMSEYYGMYRVLSALYRSNTNVNNAIKEFFDAYDKVAKEHSDFLFKKFQSNAEECEKIRQSLFPNDEPKTEQQKAFENDKLASITGTVTQLFNDRILPYIDEMKANSTLSEREKVANIKDMISLILKKSDCSTSYYENKMKYVNQADTISELLDTVMRSINNGKAYNKKG